MNKLKALGFLFVFLVPITLPTAAGLSLKTGRPNLMAWHTLFFLFVLVPACDYAFGHDSVNVCVGVVSAAVASRH